jgi:hypothetical protein
MSYTRLDALAEPQLIVPSRMFTRYRNAQW